MERSTKIINFAARMFYMAFTICVAAFIIGVIVVEVK
jgi:hypothetical protein